MRVYQGSEALGDAACGSVLTVGNFDGLHKGHQQLLASVVSRARELGVPSALYTFDPHPRAVLNPAAAPPRLMTWDQLVHGFAAEGIDVVIRETFTQAFATQGPEEFLRQVLLPRVAPAELYVGRDFHFGKGRSGSGETLSELLPQLGVRVEIIPVVRVAGEDVSSTRIRQALADGDVEHAARLLGRPYSVWGEVVSGEKRGRKLGFPTLNLAPDNELIPAHGVYATRVRLFEGDGLESCERAAVTNVGTRPTFEPGRVLAETHLLDYAGDLYGRRFALAFVGRIRAEQRFDGPDALAAQIARDVAHARELLDAPAP